MKPVVVIGAGGHGRVLLDCLLACNTPILGVCDPGLTAGAAGPFGVAVLGGDEVLETLSPAEVVLVNGLGSVKSLAARDGLYQRLSARGFGFASVIHPSAILSPHASLADGVQVMAGAVIQCGATIGANSLINTRAVVDHDCSLGRSVHIAPGATLSGGVTVGDCAHIGTGATVIQGLSIGPQALIAAGAVVYRPVPAQASVRGFGVLSEGTS